MQGAIASGVIGVSILIFVFVTMAIMLIRERRKNALKPYNFQQMIDALAEANSKLESRSPREIKRSNVDILYQIGSGAFGEVNKAILSEIPGAPGYIVAIKSPSIETGEIGRLDLLKEAAIMAQFDHPNVVRLVGVVTLGDPVLLIMEYCELGSLVRLLIRNEPSESTMYRIAIDCAHGLEYLSSRDFVHRDVAARNVLLGSDERAKIADFGMSRELADSEYYRSAGGQMPVRWTAPEAMESQRFSQQTDCWSFGVLLYEIWTRGALPYAGMQPQQVWAEVLSGYRLPRPMDCSESLYELMQQCWMEAGHRPSFSSLANALEALRQGLFSISVTASANSPAKSGTTSPDTIPLQLSGSGTTASGKSGLDACRLDFSGLPPVGVKAYWTANTKVSSSGGTEA